MAVTTTEERPTDWPAHVSDCACMGCHAVGRYDTYCGVVCEHTPSAFEVALNDVLVYDMLRQRRLHGEHAAYAEFRALKSRLVAVTLRARWPEVRR